MTAAGVAGGRPSAHQRLRITACLAFVAAPHVFHLPLWASALAAMLLLWQGLAAYRGAPPLPALLRMALAIAVFAAVFAGFGRVDGRDAGTALLLLLLVLKLSEIKSHRDAMLLLSLSYFLLITQFLFSQALGQAVYLLLGCWLVTAAMFDLNSNGSGQPLRAAARLLVQAAPIAAVMFVLFPRLPGPLWGLPTAHGAMATTGLSGTMAPGSIRRLAMSDAIVLRARFAGDLPPAQTRYWRGPVLWVFDDGVWSIGKQTARLPVPTIRAAAEAVRRVRIVPASSQGEWLIALDLPLTASVPIRRTAGATLVARNPESGHRVYTVRSATDYVLEGKLPATVRAYATRLPPQGNPRARAMAMRWRAQAPAPRAIIARALAWFRSRPFVYTLTPQAIAGRGQQIDAFLFDTREGFCAHYASAFTFLMRAAGLPARVVTGYLGGQPSIVSDYWLVRSADAHAWSEVWIEGAGWLRIDPTATVAPERIESGIAAALADDSGLPYMVRSAGSAWTQAQMLWDAANTAWNRWFLAYGPTVQARLLDGFGLSRWRDRLLALTGLVVALLTAVSLWLAWQTRIRAPRDAVLRAWRQVNRRLARRGYPRAPHEGPQAYCERLARERPDWQPELQALAAGYVALRYAGCDAPATRRRFLRAARRFCPR